MGKRGAPILQRDDVRKVSLSHVEFESLFRSGKIGSRLLKYDELPPLYKSMTSLAATATIVIHAQDCEL